MKKASTLWREFKDFAVNGNVIELAIGLVLGQAFTKVVNSLVTDIILPPIGWLVGNVDFSDLYILLKAGASAPPYASLQAAKEAGAITLNIGLLLNSIINFVIIAWALFWVVRGIGRLRTPKPAPAPAPTTKECPYCFSSIPIKATRCPYCTSHLEAPNASAQ
ncbi:MAG: large conductance mechanosensitive channel protein MscL [Chloroflexi bacterium]|nr:large conductance mechanosensitive channel protein MscL [Chloroflexota bacterium]